MFQYVIRRLLLIPPTFLGVTLLVFTITRLVPGGPVERALAAFQQQSETAGATSVSGPMASSLSEDQMEQLREYYGFNKPVIVGYLEWLGKICSSIWAPLSRFSCVTKSWLLTF